MPLPTPLHGAASSHTLLGRKFYNKPNLSRPFVHEQGHGRRTKEHHEIYVAYRWGKGKRNLKKKEKKKKGDDEKDMFPILQLGINYGTMISTTLSR